MTGSYHTWVVVLSIIVAIAASHAALSLAQRVARSDGLAATLWLLGGAVSMGMGIWSMHFIGMLAYSLPIPLAYDVPTTILSFLIAVAASGYALSIAHETQIDRFALLRSAVVLGLGITSMHYVGMIAITVRPGLGYDAPLFAASVAIAMVSSYVALRLFFSLRSLRGSRRHLMRGLAALVMGLAIAGMHYTGMSATRFPADAWCIGGVRFEEAWLAVLIAVISLGLLAITALLLLVDTHLASRARRHAEELRSVNRQLQHAATHDALTGLPNRALLMDRLAQAVAHCQRHQGGFAVAAFDLDRFKSVNDSLGHAAGDALLGQVSRRITHTLRTTDTLARMGGDEFIALLPSIEGRAEASTVLGKVQSAIGENVHLCGVDLVVGSSIGVAFYPHDSRDPEMLLKLADIAMYHAKRNARGELRFFSEGMGVRDADRLELENDLRRAIENQELAIHYQPQVDVTTSRVRGAEALLRWKHPARGMVPPSTFIPIAEETGMIHSIGEWVLREACQQLRRWHDSGFGDLKIAVNLSAEQLRRADLARQVSGCIAQAGIPPHCLELELTESVVMRDTARTIGLLEEIVALGVRISVDDFGTGYSSLSYLARLPLHTLKIDQSFIRDMEANEDSAEIVRAIVSLAHSLRLSVVAEGVETHAQRDFIRSLGCEQFQGYLSSKPVPAEEFLRGLRESGSSTSTRLRTPVAIAGTLKSAS